MTVQQRPKNLNLFTIHFPLPAIVSILHRLTGVALFVLLPYFLWLFEFSLTDDGFMAIQSYLHQSWVKCSMLLVLAPLCFHLVAGTRHLLMDIHLGEGLVSGRVASILTFVLSIGLMILLGTWIW